MREPYLDEHGDLISEEAWRSFVEGLEKRNSTTKKSNTKLQKEQSLLDLKQKLTDAIKGRIPSNKDGKVAVLFSGGVDSVLIASLLKKLAVEPLCITVGFRDGNAKEPEDVVESGRVAKELGLEHIVVLLDLERIEPLFRRTVAILGPALTTVVNVGVASVEIAAIEEAKKRGIARFFGGLGAEELFAGYDRHERAWKDGDAALHAECVAGLKRVLANDLRRDCAVAQALDVTLATPFLDEELIALSLRIPPELKINSAEVFIGRARGDVPVRRPIKKLILREAALALGLPETAAFRPKRAAQYGSRTNNALTMLAGKRGFTHKEAYLKSILAGS